MNLFSVHNDFISHLTGVKMEAFLQSHTASKRQNQNANPGLWDTRTCALWGSMGLGWTVCKDDSLKDQGPLGGPC